MTGMVEQVLRMPRITRILISGVFALATTLALSPIVDEIYLSFFLDDTTVWVPALISVSCGLVMYVAGWRLIVGTVGEINQTDRATMIYFGVGFLAIVVVVLWVVRLILIGSASLS
jgi:hypothetical protein